MSEANVVAEDGQSVLVQVDLPTNAETPVTDSEAAVAIAAIEAEAAITINAQNNETAIEIAETHAETDQTRIESNERWNYLEAEVQRLTTQNNELVTLLALQQPVSSQGETTLAEEIAEEIAEDLTPLSMSEETVSTPTEAIEEKEEEKPVAEIPPLLEIGRKPIIRLV